MKTSLYFKHLLALGTGILSLQALSAEETKDSYADVKVAVVATRQAQATLETAGSTAAITSDDLKERGATSLSDALKYETGVSVPFDFAGGSGLVPYLSGGNQGINIRGLEGNRVMILLDGIRQPEDFVAQAFLGQGGPGRIYFDPVVFAQMEIQKSATSSLYGSDSLGGTFLGQTVSPANLLGESLEGQVLDNTTTLSTANDGIHNRLAAAYGDGEWGTSIVHSYRNNKELENNGETPPNPEDFSSNAFVGKIRYKQDAWALTLTGDVFTSDNTIEGNSSEGSQFNGLIVNTNIQNEEEKDRKRFSLTADLTPADMSLYDNLSADLYYQESEQYTRAIQQGTAFFAPRDRLNEITYNTDIYGINLQADKALMQSDWLHVLTYGFEYSLSEVENEFKRTNQLTTAVEDRIGMAPSEVTRWGAFIQDEITLGDREQWVITPAIRFDSYDISPENTPAYLARTVRPDNGESVNAVDYDNTAFAPSFSVLHQMDKTWNVYGLYSRGVRNPTAEEMGGVFTHGTDFIVIPNPDLEEEISNSFEIGAQASTKAYALQIAGFYNLYDDFLENNVQVGTDGTTNVLTTVNRNEATIYGFEVSADWDLGESYPSMVGYTSGLAFTYAKGEQESLDTTTNQTVEQPLNSVDPWKLVGYLSYEPRSEDWGLTVTTTYVAKKDEDDIDTTDAALTPSDSHVLLDITGYYKAAENVTLRAGVNNLLDKKYITWATARRGAGHGSGAGSDRTTQPGVNGFVSLNVGF